MLGDSLQLPEDFLPSFPPKRRQPFDDTVTLGHVQDTFPTGRIFLQPRARFYQCRSFSKAIHTTIISRYGGNETAIAAVFSAWCENRLLAASRLQKKENGDGRDYQRSVISLCPLPLCFVSICTSSCKLYNHATPQKVGDARTYPSLTPYG